MTKTSTSQNGIISCGFLSSLFNHLIQSNLLARTLDPRSAFYIHYGSDKKPDYNFANFVYINRIPGLCSLSKKNTCFEILNRYRSFHSSVFKFYPKTFILPKEYSKYKKYHKSHPNKIFISKVAQSSHGFGCSIIRRHSDLPENTKLTSSKKRVVQEYLNKPFLMDGKKHDLRVYVAIVSYEPFVAFINEEGLARFCTEDYEEPEK